MLKDGAAIAFADESLKKNKEDVLIAVKNNGRALGEVDKSCRDDEEIVMAVI